MEKKFICPICGNSSERYIGFRNGEPYCRKCISFKGEQVNDYVSLPQKAKIFLPYSLSIEQKKLSDKLIMNYKKGINSFVNAVCGSGKTEIVLGIISYAIQCGDKVGFAVPRRDVAIELHDRFKNIFKNNRITLVYGGHHDVLNGDLVCLTSHQVFRYENYFDLLIMDEVDAFPYKGNDTLKLFFKRSLKGRYVLLSATVSNEMRAEIKQDGCEILELFERFHKHPLPVPIVEENNKGLLHYKLVKYIKEFKSQNKQVFVFCPTIEICESTYKFLKIFIKDGTRVHSKCLDRVEIIQNFRDKKFSYIVTTAVLERGVTVKDLQVIVYLADHRIYDSYSLIQIAGRVGRKKDAPEGSVIFLANKSNDAIKSCIHEITRANEHLQKVLQ